VADNKSNNKGNKGNKDNKSSKGGRDRELFPVGRHELSIAWVESGTSAIKGTPFIGFKLSDGKNVIIHRCYMTDSAQWQIETVAKSAGVDPDAVIAAANRMDDATLNSIFKGRKVLATVEADSYEKEGVLKEAREIKSIEPANAIGPGEHLVIMSAFGFSKSREKGTPALDVCFTAIDDPTGPTFWAPRWITEGSKWQVEDLAIAVGASPEAVLAAAKAEKKVEIVKALKGLKLKIVLKNEEVVTSSGKTITVTQLVGVDSMDAGIRSFMQKRRDARMEGGTVTMAPPKPKVALRDQEIPF